MLWWLLLVVALSFVVIGRRLQPMDEVHALAVYVIGGFSFIWGFAIAPASTQLLLELLACGWLRLGQTGRS